MEFDSNIEKKVFQDLLQAGWQKEDILLHQKISTQERLTEIDIVLLYQLVPMAVIEVKSSRYDLRAGVYQSLNYAELAEVPFSFITNGKEIFKINKRGNESQINKFPSPKELWEELGINWTTKDPILFPALKKNFKPRLHQAKAVSNAIESLKHNKRVAIILPVGSGKSYVALQIVWKTIKSGFYHKALILCDNVALASQLSSLFEDFGENKILITDKNLNSTMPNKSVVISNYHKFIHPSGMISSNKDFDFVVLIGEFINTLVENISNHFSNSTIMIISSSTKPYQRLEKFQIAYQYSLEDAIRAEDSEVPSGYRSLSLESIADVLRGLPITSKLDSETGTREYVLTGRSLLEGGIIDFSAVRETQRYDKRPYIQLQPHDILIGAISSGRIKVGYIPGDFNGGVSFSNALILIRVNQALVNPRDVFEFLVSPRGQLNLKRYASSIGTTAERISPSQLAKMPILIPETQDVVKAPFPLELGLVFQARETIEKDIIPLLNNLSNEEENALSLAPQLDYIAGKLHTIAINLSPPKLEDKILDQYPLPISMAYRKFLDSKFNIYERAFRLRDLFEATSFFIYNLLLIDVLRRLEPKKYRVKDAGARRAYNGYSLSKRKDFIKEILKIAKENNSGKDLFAPELVNVDVSEYLKPLEDFRNHISHTAAATERRQEKLIQKYQPIVENLLDDLSFLSAYRLVRIPEIRFVNGKFIRRMEIYSGVVPKLEEYQIPDDIEYIKAESEHLVLLDPDEQVLDLYPLYQRISSDETHDETHICFFKQRKAEQRKLEGESVQGAFPVTLDGYEDFDELQKKL